MKKLQAISERDQLLRLTGRTVTIVSKCRDIRLLLKQIENDTKSLREKYSKNATENEKEILSLLSLHLQDCTRLEKYSTKGECIDDDDDNGTELGLFNNLFYAYFNTKNIDDRVLAPFANLQEQNSQIDQGLTDIGQHVERLRAVALDIKDVIF